MMKNYKTAYLISIFVGLLSLGSARSSLALDLTSELEGITQEHNQRAGVMEQERQRRVEEWRRAINNMDSSSLATSEAGETQSAPPLVISSPNSPSLLNIGNNGRISGNPSYIIACSWGRKTIIRKNNKWTDGLGNSFSDRTWGLELLVFAEKICNREV